MVGGQLHGRFSSVPSPFLHRNCPAVGDGTAESLVSRCVISRAALSNVHIIVVFVPGCWAYHPIARCRCATFSFPDA